MEVNVHLKKAFQAELETEGSRLTTILGLPPTPPQYQVEGSSTPCGAFFLGCMKAPQYYKFWCFNEKLPNDILHFSDDISTF